MNRIIKFRVMSINGNWNYYTLGDFVCQTPIPAEICPETWTQFTGLSDMNGVEIYESDILLLNDVFVAETSFINGCFSVITKSIYAGRENELNSLSYFETIKVIGNIYQNKE